MGAPAHLLRRLPMTQNLIKAGYKVVVWNRNLDRAVPLQEAGAEVRGMGGIGTTLHLGRAALREGCERGRETCMGRAGSMVAAGSKLQDVHLPSGLWARC